MPAKLTTTIKNIDSVPDLTNTAIVKQFHQFMKDNGASERHQNNNLKTVLTSGITLPSMPFIFLFPLPFFVCRFVVVVIVVYVFYYYQDTFQSPFGYTCSWEYRHAFGRSSVLLCLLAITIFSI